MKCPACGFETPDAQGWCDFCKEPFRRTQKDAPASAEPAHAAPPAPVVPAPAPAKSPAIVPSAPAAVPASPAGSASTEPAPKLTPEQAFELLRLDPGERIPPVSPALRYAAYGFLLVCLLWAAAMTMILMNRAQRMQTAPPPAEASAEVPVPASDVGAGEAGTNAAGTTREADGSRVDPAMTR
ncbi:MAG: hypothetical protein WC969_05740 [Elusimicrobiota bacterium]|jgi:hypothetical protein